MNKLFETVVGSHAWKMNKPKSDFDIFQVYQIPTRYILSGGYEDKTALCAKENGNDVSRHEIGNVIEQLLKGNFNYIVGICSPIINEDKYGYLKELSKITKRNLAKNIHHSTLGLASHQKRKYLDHPEKSYSSEEIQKKINLIVRSLMFGEWILREGKINFYPIVDQEKTEIQYWINRINEAYELSELPKVPNPTEFREFLYKIRMDELKGIEGYYKYMK
jgi:predicted nucleotidyltransferase